MTAVATTPLQAGEQRTVRNNARFIADYYLRLAAIRAEEKSRTPTDAQIDRTYRQFRRLWSRTAYAKVNDLSSAARTWADWHWPLLQLLGISEPPTSREIDIDPEHVTLRAYEDGGHPALLVDPLPFAKTPDERLETGQFRGTAQRRMERALEGSAAPFGLILGGTRWRIVKLDTANEPRFLEFDLAAIHEVDDLDAFGLLLTLVSPTGLLGDAPLLTDLVERSEVRGTQVGEELGPATRRALQSLLESVRTDDANTAWAGEAFVDGELLQAIHREGIYFLYRLLFVLYAEANGALPLDKPLYRDNYSLERVRAELSQGVSFAENSYALWDSVQALFRLIDSGVHAKEMTIPAYNGGLFAPERTVRLDRAIISDAALARVLRELTTVTLKVAARKQTDRVSFRELGVDQLGAVFESLLDYEPHIAHEDLFDVPVGAGKDKGVSFLPASMLREVKDAPALPGVGKGQFYLQAWGGQRKSTGAFYTPRPIADYLVREALRSQVEGKSSRDILEIAVCDPAMGSGGFLVSATEFLGKAYYEARVREGACDPQDDNADQDRVEAKRLAAERCVYGVDLNPMAVELAKVSLWLTTLSFDRPLSFFDHHLRCGNSLLGAPLRADGGNISGEHIQTLPDAAFAAVDKEVAAEVKARIQTIRKRNSAQIRSIDRAGRTSMFVLDLQEPVHAYAKAREQLSADDPTQSAEDAVALIRAKERQLRDLTEDPRSEFFRIKEICDLWMAPWFWPHDAEIDPPTTDEYQELSRDILYHGGPRSGRGQVLIDETRRTAKRHRFFHWELEFPEVFERGGFHAIVGNPPWDVVEPKTKEFFANYDPRFREYSKQQAIRRMRQLNTDRDTADTYRAYASRFHKQSAFLRLSGTLPWLAIDGGKLDLFRAFAERDSKAVRSGGSVAVVLPESFYINSNCSQLRRRLAYMEGRIRLLIVNQNERFVFPVTHNKKVCLVVADRGGQGSLLKAAFFVGKSPQGTMRALSLRELEAVMAVPERHLIDIPTSFLERVSGDDFAFMEITDSRDVALLEHFAREGVALSQSWDAQYCQEINMTSDSHLFVDRADLERLGAVFDGMRWHHATEGDFWPLVEGKNIYQYEFPVGEFKYWISARHASKLSASSGEPNNARPRLAWRSVGNCLNERSVIAQVVPARSFLGNSLKSVASGLLSERKLNEMLALFDSLAFDWQARIRGATNLTYGLIEAIFVPCAVAALSIYRVDRIETDVAVMSAFHLPFELAQHLMTAFPLLDRLQPALLGESRSTITRDLVLARYGEMLGHPKAGFYRDRANDATALGAVPFVPATRVETT